MNWKKRGNEVRAYIADLSESSPQSLNEAKQRAKQETDAGWIVGCPICDDGTRLDVLHIFPPLVHDLDDPQLGEDIHIKCPKCQHEDMFTVEFHGEVEAGYDHTLEMEKTGAYPQGSIDKMKGLISGHKRRKRRKRK